MTSAMDVLEYFSWSLAVVGILVAYYIVSD